jgi:hypothetical protein
MVRWNVAAHRKRNVLAIEINGIVITEGDPSARVI